MTEWSSCSSSTLGPRAYNNADILRRKIDSVRHIEEVFTEYLNIQATKIRERFFAAFNIKSEKIDFVLTSSATDAEFIPLSLALNSTTDDLLNIVVAPNEIGSASVSAAKGTHICQITPAGAAVQPSLSLDGISLERIETHQVKIREKDGELRCVESIHEEIANQVQEGVAEGKRILLHLIDCSKLGARIPSLDFVDSLKKQYGEKIQVIIDAAQMRIDPRLLHNYLSKNWLILVSGSKFFGGPPFSGGVLIRGKFWQQGAKKSPPLGLRDYLTKFDVPSSWINWQNALPRKINVGLLLRWEAALAEIEAFMEVPPLQRRTAIEKLGKIINTLLHDSKDVQRILLGSQCTSIVNQCPKVDGLSQLSTIFPFVIFWPKGKNKGSKLSVYETRLLHRMLNQPLAHGLPKSSPKKHHKIMNKRFITGQPVRLGTDAIGSLRLAISARRISDLFEENLNDMTSLDQKLEIISNELEELFIKIELCLRYWDRFLNVDELLF